jgi:thiol:disulfide interchange protein
MFAIKTLLISALTALATQALALNIVPYSAEALKAAQADGKPVALHFHAKWCSTCRAQERAFLGLKDAPALKDVTLFVADYDKEKPLRKSLNVRNQSTLIVYKGTQQTALIAGETEPGALQRALLTGL